MCHILSPYNGKMIYSNKIRDMVRYGAEDVMIRKEKWARGMELKAWWYAETR